MTPHTVRVRVAKAAGGADVAADDEVETVCQIAWRTVAVGAHLEELLQALVSYSVHGRGVLVIEAERRSRDRAATNNRWRAASTLLRHALETGLFHDTTSARVADDVD
jgi:hypothetical protein